MEQVLRLSKNVLLKQSIIYAILLLKDKNQKLQSQGLNSPFLCLGLYFKGDFRWKKIDH